MYFSSFVLVTLGGDHCDFGLNGYLLPSRLLLQKWCVIRRRLAKSFKFLLRLDLSGGAGAGAYIA